MTGFARRKRRYGNHRACDEPSGRLRHFTFEMPGRRMWVDERKSQTEQLVLYNGQFQHEIA